MTSLDLHKLANQPGLARPMLLAAGALNGEDATQPLWEVIAWGSIPIGCTMHIHAASAAEATEIMKVRVATARHQCVIDEIGDPEFDRYETRKKDR